MSNPNEPSLTSTDQVILSRLTRMAGISEDLRLQISNFKQKFIASTNEIINQRRSLDNYIAIYKEKSRNCTIYKTQIQKLQVRLCFHLEMDISFQVSQYNKQGNQKVYLLRFSFLYIRQEILLFLHTDFL